MKRLLWALPIVMFITSCGEPQAPSAGERLKQLRADKMRIEAEIKKLESTLSDSENAATAMPVSVQPAAASELVHFIDVKGTVDARSTITLSPQMGGRITKVNVSPGQPVTAGQVLVELDDELIRKGIKEVEVQLDFARTLFEKQRRIFEQKAGSEIQYLTAKNQLEALERRMESLQEQRTMSRITAPRSGFAENIMAKVGEMAMPGMPALTIVNMSDVRVVVDVAETFLSTVTLGDRVKIEFPEISDTVSTTIKAVSRLVNPASRTFRLEIPLSPVPAALRPNITCRVSINDVTLKNVLVLPLAAVLHDNRGAYVYVVGEKNVVRRIDITTGLSSGGDVQITSGLESGQRVVTKGATMVSAGQTVRIVG
ncbi:MAG: efflux RND transporter periplasmic adaptor subunit [Candidatus Kapabacteria bacterium]|nr:efflux RND transporter periplasmic adaptor subunit [Candidatus Kapabacteria bacterium]